MRTAFDQLRRPELETHTPVDCQMLYVLVNGKFQVLECLTSFFITDINSPNVNYIEGWSNPPRDPDSEGEDSDSESTEEEPLVHNVKVDTMIVHEDETLVPRQVPVLYHQGGGIGLTTPDVSREVFRINGLRMMSKCFDRRATDIEVKKIAEKVNCDKFKAKQIRVQKYHPGL